MAEKEKEKLVSDAPEKTQGLIEILGGETSILSQVQNEFKLCYDHLRPKINEWLVRLTLYNNQKRDKSKVGDPLLFTVFQTLFASLYEDRLNVEFLPREEGDIEVSENLNSYAEFSYDEMEKDILDFEWIWDTMFFGRGLLLNQEFNRKLMRPVPQVIDPSTFLRDPEATSVNGNINGYNAARFCGREVALMAHQMERSKNYFNVKQLKTGKELRSLLARMKEARNTAQGLANMPQSKEDDLKQNAQFNLLEWFTHIKGKKYLVAVGNSMTKLVRITAQKEDKWPINDRSLFPIAHDWDGVSVPDLIEDKQRARAVLQNLGLESAKADVYPMYLFDENKVKNRADLNFGFNKFIRVDGSTQGAVEPMQKAVVHQTAGWIMDLLDQSAQRALATPEIQQGIVGKKQRTLGELELVSSKVDTRYSLAAKIFGWSDKRFWNQHHKRHFKEGIDKKMSRTVGVWGPEFRKFERKDLIANVDPDIKIESSIVAQAQKKRDFNRFVALVGMSINDRGTNRRFAFKRMAKLSNLKTEEVKMLYPPTLDEMQAERENDQIEKKEQVRVEIREDHQLHIQIHAKLNESPRRDKHIEAHKHAMFLKRKNEVLFREKEARESPAVSPVFPPGEGEGQRGQSSVAAPAASSA